ncbi:hypothetical protein EZV61_19055 [Corallincola luteus]|uniref:Uncharacterized protein n=1 Tax=Corallincola luteus TaxID=1775177 RepID=A0ABY2AHB6_9GAMM|nr:hypothetical protein [Corallincola luteus]TCI01188.1 hypothetical protein EZV61_19055 [Corallincola luteus]
MSYIDSFDHEYIGYLGYLPIYRPLQEIKGDKWGGYDFSAKPNNLVLGGGSGEHPGLVVHKLESVAAKFLYDQLLDEEEEKISKVDTDYIIDLCYADEILEFCSWSINQFAELKEMAEAKTFMTPLAEDEEVEDWLCKSIGELVFYSLRDLNPEHSKLLRIFSPFNIQATMRNVACPPPGLPSCGGRRVIDGELKWGLNRWQIKP